MRARRASGRQTRGRAEARVSGQSPKRAVRLPPRGADLEPADGSQRVRLRFLPDGAEVRVPSGTPIFDAASWNGIAIDSTCGGHATLQRVRARAPPPGG